MKRFKLAVFRIRHELKQHEIAKKLGISTSHYAAIENGIADPSYKILVKFDDVFKDEKLDVFDIFKKEERKAE